MYNIFVFQEDNEAYQIAAKEALDKLHAEKLQAVALAVEQERAKEAAEQDAQISKEHFEEAHLELEVKTFFIPNCNLVFQNVNLHPKIVETFVVCYIKIHILYTWFVIFELGMVVQILLDTEK